MDGNKVNSAGIQKEVLYMLVSQPNNYPLPIQEGVDDKGNKVLSVADGAKQEVLRVHFQNNLSSYVKVIGIQVADQSNVLETKENKVINADMELYPVQLQNCCCRVVQWKQKTEGTT